MNGHFSLVYSLRRRTWRKSRQVMHTPSHPFVHLKFFSVFHSTVPVDTFSFPDWTFPISCSISEKPFYSLFFPSCPFSLGYLLQDDPFFPVEHPLRKIPVLLHCRFPWWQNSTSKRHARIFRLKIFCLLAAIRPAELCWSELGGRSIVPTSHHPWDWQSRVFHFLIVQMSSIDWLCFNHQAI